MAKNWRNPNPKKMSSKTRSRNLKKIRKDISFYEKKNLAIKIRKIQSIPVSKMTKAQANRMNRLIAEYIRKFS